MTETGRIYRHGRVSTALSALGDDRIAALVAGAPLLGSGMGGSASLLDVDGAPVFAKRIPLTDRELGTRSTANLFGLPDFYQYGVGSAGFGVWRELAAHEMTTEWVLSGECALFPLLYHWRVLPGAPPRMPARDLAADVEYWGTPAVRDRLEAVEAATNSVVLFCEYFPRNLHEWLSEQDGPDADVLAMVERDLLAGTKFLRANGVVHFDGHFGNILTDCRGLYFADLGLATSSRFDLSPSEREFMARHELHDSAYVVTQLVNWLVTELCGATNRADLVALVRRAADGEAVVDPPAAAVVKRYAPVAAVMNAFYGKLHLESRTFPFPTDELARSWAALQPSEHARRPAPPRQGLLQQRGDLDQDVLAAVGGDELDADRHSAFTLPQRQTQRGLAGEVEDDGEGAMCEELAQPAVDGVARFIR